MKPLKPQEVRLGNLTSYGFVSSIDKDVFSTVKDGKIYHSIYTPIYPVSLTPEILQGFGFEVYDEDDLFTCFRMKYKRTFFSIRISKISAKLNKIHWPMGVSTLPIHAHTLQNFVQSISGVELVFNNKSEQK